MDFLAEESILEDSIIEVATSVASQNSINGSDFSGGGLEMSFIIPLFVIVLVGGFLVLWIHNKFF